MKKLMNLLKRERAVEPSLFKVAEEQFAEWKVDIHITTSKGEVS